VPDEREFSTRLADGVMIRVRLSGRPIERYAVLLLAWRDAAWQEIRLYDNHLGSHHMHRYTRSHGKQPAEEFHPGPANAAIPAAIAHLKSAWQDIMLSWER